MESISRKTFIQSSGLLLASEILVKKPDAFASGAVLRANKPAKKWTLKNVRLETGFMYEDGEVIATQTGLFRVEIEDGKIKAVLPNDPKAEATDAKGQLMLPAFRDMHIHLDKTFYGGPWKARLAKNRSVKDMIVFEQKTLPELLKTSTYRAEKIIELLQSKGTNFARSHVNIEPTSKLDSLKNLQKAIENKKDTFGTELVAFPQHGVFYSHSEQLMKEAAAMDIDFIGGLDPNAIDGSVEKQIDFIVQLALDHSKGIDIHLHEGGEPGLRTVEYLTQKVLENPALADKTFLSHCFVLARLEKPKLEETAEKLAHARVGVISTVPFGNTIMPIPTLYRYGVNVMTGNDSIVDHWNTFGTGSVLQKANMMAQLYGQSTELDLSRCLKLATCNILPLDEKGKQQWPKAGDEASVVLVDASCSAEAVARVSPVKALVHHGNLVYRN
ncbi:amidohydrolase family protein [Dyadobacter endophyticus]|uniref:amidohydrolase family protein n=1 Tax=Dyadobacter endophyticus TaxID=1749036 RepID=UPI003CEC42A7